MLSGNLSLNGDHWDPKNVLALLQSNFEVDSKSYYKVSTTLQYLIHIITRHQVFKLVAYYTLYTVFLWTGHP